MKNYLPSFLLMISYENLRAQKDCSNHIGGDIVYEVGGGQKHDWNGGTPDSLYLIAHPSEVKEIIIRTASKQVLVVNKDDTKDVFSVTDNDEGDNWEALYFKNKKDHSIKGSLKIGYKNDGNISLVFKKVIQVDDPRLEPYVYVSFLSGKWYTHEHEREHNYK